MLSGAGEVPITGPGHLLQVEVPAGQGVGWGGGSTPCLLSARGSQVWRGPLLPSPATAIVKGHHIPGIPDFALTFKETSAPKPRNSIASTKLRGPHSGTSSGITVFSAIFFLSRL